MKVTYTDGVRKVTHVWAMVCDSWGVHAVGQIKEDLEEEDRKLRRNSAITCGPHEIVKLEPKKIAVAD